MRAARSFKGDPVARIAQRAAASQAGTSQVNPHRSIVARRGYLAAGAEARAEVVFVATPDVGRADSFEQAGCGTAGPPFNPDDVIGE